MTRELMVMLASSMDIDWLAERIQTRAEVVKLNPEDSNAVAELNFYCHLLIMQQVTKGDLKKAAKVVKEMEQTEQIMSRMDAKN